MVTQLQGLKHTYICVCGRALARAHVPHGLSALVMRLMSGEDEGVFKQRYYIKYRTVIAVNPPGAMEKDGKYEKNDGEKERALSEREEVRHNECINKQY